MEIHVSDLIFEITRRCNMQCSHCLRGESQDMDMSHEVIDAVLDQVDQVGCIMLTGGEPSLAVDVIEYLIEGLKKRDITPEYFYCVTNGKAVGMDFIHVLMELYAVCYDSEELCALELSRDQYHHRVEIPKTLNALKFFRPENRKKHLERDTILNEGRANENGIGYRPPEEVREFGVSLWDDDVQVEQLYVSSNGNIVPICDISFDRIDEESLGNILTTSLGDILAPSLKKEAA